MIKWQMWVDEHQPSRGQKSAWINFSDHVDVVMEKTHGKRKGYMGDKWKHLCKLELEKWQATLEEHPLEPPSARALEWYLEFPDLNSVLAFEITWS